MRPSLATRRPRRATAVALALSLASLGPLAPVARAAPDAAAAKVDRASHDRAQKAFQESVKLYKAGQYRAAADKLTEARKLDPTDKDLPYNLGLVHEKLNDLDAAIRNFELYLSLETDEAEKERVRATIQRLQGARAEQARAAASARPSATPAAASSSAPAPPPPPPTASEAGPTRRRGRLDGLVYASGGLAVAAAAVGVVFGVRALGQRPESGGDRTYAEREDDQKKAHKSAVVADIGFGVAGAAGVTAVLLYLLRDEAAPGSSAFVAPAPGGAAAGWAGRF